MDIGLDGVFVERSEPLPPGEPSRSASPGRAASCRSAPSAAWRGGTPRARRCVEIAASGAGLQFDVDVGRRSRAAARHLVEYSRQHPRRAPLPAPLAGGRARSDDPTRLSGLPRVRIVLVRPESAANIGACARVARNTGAAGLDLVQPGRLAHARVLAQRLGRARGARAGPRLRRPRGGAGRCRRWRSRSRAAGPPGTAPVEDVREAAARIAALARRRDGGARLRPRGERALERRGSGLRPRGDDPVAPARSPPTTSRTPSRSPRTRCTGRCGRARATTARRATHDEKQRLLELLRAGLEAIHALPPANAERCFADWRALVQRAELTAKELKLLSTWRARWRARGGDG